MKASVKTLTPEQRATMDSNGIKPFQFRHRIAAGWSLSAALNTLPGDYAKRHCVNGKRASLAEHCRDAGLKYATVYGRMRLHGMSLDEALSMPLKRTVKPKPGPARSKMDFLTAPRLGEAA